MKEIGKKTKEEVVRLLQSKINDFTRDNRSSSPEQETIHYRYGWQDAIRFALNEIDQIKTFELEPHATVCGVCGGRPQKCNH